MLSTIGRPVTIVALIACGLCGGGQNSWAQPRAKNGQRQRDVSQFRKQLTDRRARYAAALEKLAGECDSQGLDIAAEEIRRLAVPADGAELRLTPLPREVQPAIPQSLPTEERRWRTQLRTERQEYAKDLYTISRYALNSGHVGFAYDVLRETALNDPEHVAARRILGYVRNGDEWISAFESRMLKDKKAWHDQFGWVPKEHVERYERGERYVKNRWMSAAKEAELRREFANAWEIRTEHYLVKTNHSQEKGVELARKLEDFHGLFFQLMAGFFNTPDQVQQLFAGHNARPQIGRPNVVHFYRSQEEYTAVVREQTNQPVQMTRGMYFPRSGIAYFYFDHDADDDSTLYHEGTHQLLSGSRPQIGEIGVRSNFWIIEGIACYMESFRRDGRKFSVGDPAHDRLQAARAHFINEGYYVPLREFTRMGMTAFQGDRQIRKNYSQGAALTHFFMHYSDGRYREALIDHISQVYSPNKLVREAPESLEALTEVEAEELDRQYAEYIRNLTPQLARQSADAAQ
ncbi:MAG: hypothetical protein ACT4QC_13065 [Planctomycetaceae bacterium]